jgi:hypothetical protein
MWYKELIKQMLSDENFIKKQITARDGYGL